jgi:translation elongation factor P/translation initiation factor 5A
MIEIQEIKKGDVFVIDNETYRVNNIEVSKIGKHGRAKVRLEVVNVKTNEERVLIRVSTELVEKK